LWLFVFYIHNVMVLVNFLLNVLRLNSQGDAVTASTSHADYEQHASAGLAVLQTVFYDWSNGLWTGYNATCNCSVPFWWNSAVALTTLADFTALVPSALSTTGPVFSNTFKQAQDHPLQESKLSPTDRCIWPLTWTCPNGQPPVKIPGGYLNGYFDDEGWWALAWLRVYDITRDEVYLQTAVGIFNDMLSTGYNGTCGAMYWDRAKTYQNAIVNELFLAVSAMLANRVANGAYYLNWALKQWEWLRESGMINRQNLINDGLTVNCTNNGGTTWSYNQGVILEALVELNIASPDPEYLKYATNIASAAIADLSDSNGILTEADSNKSPDLGFDGPQFKGIFMRNLQVLQNATGDADFAAFIKTNADSIWSNDRSRANGTFGNVWDKYYGQELPQGHSSALAAIVAAVGISGY
jgi:predicted alpha-1,6-mannanase (GH76 family)